MSKTVILWFCIYTGGILVSVFKGPIYALLIYMFTFYTQVSWMHKHHYLGRWSLYSSIALIGSYIIHKNNEEKLSHFKIAPLKWLLLYVADMLVVSLVAVDPKANTAMVAEVIKFVVLYYLIVCVVRTKMHYKMFLWLQLWGNFLFGWQGYDHKTSGGRLEGVGGASTNTSNGLANHLIMILPFMNNFFFYGNKWEKIAAVLAAPWVLNAIILCNSRGAFLGLLIMCIIALFRAEKKVRKKIVVGMVLGSILFTYLTDDRFWTRMDTIDDPGQKGGGRVQTWQAAVEMIKDHPFGAGGDGWLYYSPVYIPYIVAAYDGQRRSVHNSYLKVAADYGIQGLVIYLLFLASTLYELHKIRKRAGTADDAFYYAESTAIETAIWGFLVAATFGARPYFEALFWYSALGIALSNLQQSEIKDRENIQNKVPDRLNSERSSRRAHARQLKDQSSAP